MVLKRHRKRDADHLPAHVGIGFVEELKTLVKGLSSNLPGSSPESFKRNYLEKEFLSKYCDSTTMAPELRRTASITKWLRTETKNASTNQRLLLESCDFGWTTSDHFDQEVRLRIKKILGPLVYPDVLTNGTHTFGASTRVSRSEIAAVKKHAGRAHCSGSALADWSLIGLGTILEDQPIEIQDSSVLFTVPKSSEIDRVACKEPEVNMFMQRSVGAHIRRRLRRVGVDLNDQTVNQHLAKIAVDQGLATIDLSAASDSITEQLVVNWLPPEWFLLLNRLRVHNVDVDGTLHPLQMFSSMGNGFTFELESLLFYAMTKALAYLNGIKGRISVYGDDIIAPAGLVPRMIRVFSWYGFTINPKKSSWRGGFRESCGKHYYFGWDVTPFYVREPVTVKSDMIRLLNRLFVWDRSGTDYILTQEVYEFHKKWAQIIPLSLHGGQDPEDITSLVTGAAPRLRLSKRKKKVVYDNNSGLAFWLTTKGRGARNYGLKPDIFYEYQETGPNVSPLALTPKKEGRSHLIDHSPWLRIAKWKPYGLYGDPVWLSPKVPNSDIRSVAA